MCEKVSVIIPVYNVERYLSECIESVIDQDYLNFEVILIDDGSTDSSGKICDKYTKKNKFIKVFHIENGGVSNARNYGIKKATGKYILFLDSDDIIDRCMISSMVDGFQNQDIQMVACGYCYKYKNKEVIPNFPSDVVLSKDDTIRQIFNDGFIQGFSVNKLFVREIIIKNNLQFDNKIKICEDILFVVEYLSKIKSISIISKPMYHYRMRKSSASNFNNEKDLTVFDAYHKMKLIDSKIEEYINDKYWYLYFKYYKLLKSTKKINSMSKRTIASLIFDKGITLKTKLYALYYYFVPNSVRNKIKKSKQDKNEYYD